MSRARERTVFFPWERRSPWRGIGSRRRLRQGVALLTVVGVIVAMEAVEEHRRRTFATWAAIWSIQDAVASFRADHGRCPASQDELVHPPELPVGASRYLHEPRSDGWGRPFRITCPGRKHPGSADVVSGGSSGTFQDLAQIE